MKNNAKTCGLDASRSVLVRVVQRQHVCTFWWLYYSNVSLKNWNQILRAKGCSSASWCMKRTRISLSCTQELAPISTLCLEEQRQVSWELGPWSASLAVSFLPLVPFSLQNIYTFNHFNMQDHWACLGHANCPFSVAIRYSVQAQTGLFPCPSFMWLNEVSGEWLSLCLRSCNSSALIAWFSLARSLTCCWTYVFVSRLAEQIVLFVTRSSSVTDRPAGAAWTSSRVRCLFRLWHRGADPVTCTQTKWDLLSFRRQ